MATPTNPPKQSFRLISTREQRKQFDNAVKDVIRQRKASNQLQQTVQQAKKLEKQQRRRATQQGSGTTNTVNSALAERELQQTQARLKSLVQSPGFASVLAQQKQINGVSTRASIGDVRPASLAQLREEHRPRSGSGGTSGGGGAAAVGGGGNNSKGGGWDVVRNRVMNRRASFAATTAHSSKQLNLEGFTKGNRRSSDGDTSRIDAGGNSSERIERPQRPTFNRSTSSSDILDRGGKLDSSPTPPPQSGGGRPKKAARLGKLSLSLGGDRGIGDDEDYDYEQSGSGSGGKKSSYAQGGSIGDSLEIPVFRLKGQATQQGTTQRDSVSKSENERMAHHVVRLADGEVGGGNKVKVKQALTPGRIITSTVAGGQEGGKSAVAMGSPLGNSSKSSIGIEITNSLGGIKLEDLVPTRKTSRENSQRSNELLDDSNKDVQVAFGKEWEGVQQKQGDMKCVSSSGASSYITANTGRDLDSSYATARSRESPGTTSLLSTPELEIDKLMSQDPSPSGEGQEVCPRSQFVLLKSQCKSHSGATGRTQGTSNSSLFSSNSSLVNNNENSAANNSGSGNNNQNSTFEVIKEEEKIDIGSSVSTASGIRERTSGDTFQARHHDLRYSYDDIKHEVDPGSSSYKSKRSGRLKQIQKSVQSALSGGTSGKEKGLGSVGEQSSHGGGSISADQKERVSRHLQRKSSTRSISSAFSTFSGFRGDVSEAGSMSSNVSTTSSKGWRRFKPKRPGMRNKAQSMRNMSMRSSGNSFGSSGRQILIDNQRPSVGNISNMSSRSNLSSDGDSGRFSDFYDHHDHVKAVSSLISHKSSSGRSLVTPLATVPEPSHNEGEQKFDEDYHHQKNIRAVVNINDSNRSDDSVASLYRHPSHEHTLVHMRPNQLFPDSPGWQCDECTEEEFDLNVWAYVSTEKNYLLCERCFAKNGFSMAG